MDDSGMTVIKLPPRHVPEHVSVRRFVSTKNRHFMARFKRDIDRYYTEFKERPEKSIEEELK